MHEKFRNIHINEVKKSSNHPLPVYLHICTMAFVQVMKSFFLCFSKNVLLNLSEITLQCDVVGIDYCTTRYENCAKVPLVLTVIYMPVGTATNFLSLHSVYPLSSCTYYGIDNGSPGLQVFYFLACLNYLETFLTIVMNKTCKLERKRVKVWIVRYSEGN